jgi:outer membrane autotransporter protein
MDRRITYPSLNPLVASIDHTTSSETDSQTVILTLGGGVSFNLHGFTFEPFAKAEYEDISIDGFTESGSSGFELTYGGQDIKSCDVAVGFKVNYAWTPSFGVVVPYARGEAHKQLENDRRTLSSLYAGLPAPTSVSAESFDLATDAPDDQFFLAAAGFSLVWKHGLQGFLQYQQIFGLETFEDHAITGGIRVEF